MLASNRNKANMAPMGHPVADVLTETFYVHSMGLVFVSTYTCTETASRSIQMNLLGSMDYTEKYLALVPVKKYHVRVGMVDRNNLARKSNSWLCLLVIRGYSAIRSILFVKVAEKHPCIYPCRLASASDCRFFIVAMDHTDSSRFSLSIIRELK